MTPPDRRSDWRTASGEIVLRRCGGIGDILCCTPALAAIRAARPEARIAFETDCRNAGGGNDALLENPDVDEVRLPRWDEATTVDFQGAEFQHLWPDDPDAPRVEATMHLVDAMATAAGLELTGDARRPRLRLSIEEDAWAGAAFPPEFIAVAVHTAARIRDWRGWAELYAPLYAATGLPIILLGQRPGSGRRESPPPLPDSFQGTPPAVRDYRGATTHRQAFAAVSRATLFVGPDSSLAHAAGAFSVPSVVLGGAVRPVQRVHAGQTPLTANVACGGCYHRPDDGRYGFNDQCAEEQRGAMPAPDGSSACMAAISPGAVLAACLDRMNRGVSE